MNKTDEIVNKLDKIIRLLEKDPEEIVLNCNCHLHTSGQLTCGWWCPVHGQMF